MNNQYEDELDALMKPSEEKSKINMNVPYEDELDAMMRVSED